MKNILLPIDFYDDSQRVLRGIVSFLEGVQGDFKLFLLTTYMVPLAASAQIINAHDALRNQSLERLKNTLQVAQKLLNCQPQSGVEGKTPSGFAGGGGDVSPYKRKLVYETVAQMGTPANVISRIVKEKNIDCVIVGMKVGKTGGPKQEIIINLLHQINCPVVILPLPDVRQ